MDAVPLEDTDPAGVNATVTFDATSVFAGFTELQATEYVFDRYVNSTTTLSMMNPGFDFKKSQLHPPLTGNPIIGLADFIVKERLFNMFLANGCIPLTKENALMQKIVQNNPWPRPISVFGYNNAHPVFGGDLFEAETSCTKQHNMGQVASDNVNNLGFWSRGDKAITEPLVQNPDPDHDAFNASRTYISLVVGDGDNVAFVKGSRKSWMKDRLARCTASPSTCFPLGWSLSPHIFQVAPEWARWYYNISYSTKADYFVLPPSGHTYSYPSQMPSADQDLFVTLTERDCYLLNTSATVAWESAGTWGGAIREYFPKYAAKGVVRSMYAVNVPYDLPVEFALSKRKFKVVGTGATPAVLFAPHEWRGESAGCAGAAPFGKRACLTAAAMAAEINGYPGGTATAIYLTSDGGGSLDTLYRLVPLLGEHVRVVNHNQLAKMALASTQ
eukprot:TRINITY_DN3406_c0_g1_i1.p1 TRINITY_DN3406_c0_g1~~TRINITY_DN3406_c0_g1_i1.p1  ORF type:complete len:444 (+),score=82.85 TRINITY_DN3406_c0_g1_i1:513-1844(+)